MQEKIKRGNFSNRVLLKIILIALIFPSVAFAIPDSHPFSLWKLKVKKAGEVKLVYCWPDGGWERLPSKENIKAGCDYDKKFANFVEILSYNPKIDYHSEAIVFGNYGLIANQTIWALGNAGDTGEGCLRPGLNALFGSESSELDSIYSSIPGDKITACGNFVIHPLLILNPFYLMLAIFILAVGWVKKNKTIKYLGLIMLLIALLPLWLSLIVVLLAIIWSNKQKIRMHCKLVPGKEDKMNMQIYKEE